MLSESCAGKVYIITTLVLLLTMLIFVPAPAYADTPIQGMEINFGGALDNQIPDINITKITALSVGKEIEYRLYYEGSKVKKYNMFNPPNGNILQTIKYVSQEDINNGYLSFRVPLETVKKCDWFTIFVSDTLDYSRLNSYSFPNSKIDYSKAPGTIEFADSNLTQAVKGSLNIKGSIFETDVQNIEVLDLSNKGIADLQGIEHFNNLKILNISNNKITDISPVNKLNKLEKLYVKRNPINDYLLEESIILGLADFDFEQDYQRALYADKLKEIGVFRGTDNGLELFREPTRLEAIIMLIRLSGKEAEALKTDSTISMFTDVPTWAVSYTNYAYHHGLTKGMGNNKFGSNDKIDAKSYITFLLRVLGYNDNKGDFSWNEAIFFAQNIKMYDNAMQIELNSTEFLRAHVAEISYKTLGTKVKGTNTTLIQKLIQDNIINKELAEKLRF